MLLSDFAFTAPMKRTEAWQPLYLATVGSYTTAGVALIFDGQTTATTKRYKRLASYTPAAGDRVLVAKISGSYVILGKITY